MSADEIRDLLAEQAWGVLVAAQPDRTDDLNVIAHAIVSNQLPIVDRLVADELLTVADMAAERERVEGGDTGAAFREFALYLRARAAEAKP